jgi:hypothetical protein
MLVPKTRTPNDLQRVNLDEEWEIDYWCAHFKCGPDELRASVLAVGPHVDDVDRQLKAAARVAFKKMGED